MSDFIIPRRSFLKVLTGIVAAPAVIKADQLMQVKTIFQPESLVGAEMRFVGLAPLKTEGGQTAFDNIAPRNKMDLFRQIVMEALNGIEGKYDEIDKRTLDRMFTPQRKGLFS